MNKFNRLLGKPEKTFLLLGPRGTGKSTWLADTLTNPRVINLLESDKFFRYKANPSALRVDLADLPSGSWVVIDEVQRVPELLNEVHSLYETKGLEFALAGSSARKLRRADANLLAGRALRCDFFPLVGVEILDESLINQSIEFGTLPSILKFPHLAADALASYVETYLKEEIAAESLTRSLEPFARFLMVAAQHHAQLLNVESVAQQSAIKRRSVDNYFQILEDTLLGFRLPAANLGARAREAAHPKFYFFDAGVARGAAGWLREQVPDAWRGFSFESLVLNEIRAYNSYQKKDKNIFHYTVNGSFDIDFLIEHQKKILHQAPSYIAIEVKLAKQWRSEWTDVLNNFSADKKSKVVKSYGVYLGNETLTYGSLTVMNFQEFSRQLWSGRIF